MAIQLTARDVIEILETLHSRACIGSAAVARGESDADAGRLGNIRDALSVLLEECRGGYLENQAIILRPEEYRLLETRS